MACLVASNRPLEDLRRSLGLGEQCHSHRAHCVSGLPARDGRLTMGIVGAALGYCQALFVSRGDPREHSEYVRDVLTRHRLPWAGSHELFWDYRGDHCAATFIERAVQPLCGTGRVPILITGLDPADDMGQIEEIVRVAPGAFEGEPILLRVVLRSARSGPEYVRLVNALVSRATQEARMPAWWPLVQGDLTVEEWGDVRRTMGTNWQFANVAVNPFVPSETLDAIKEQVTVAQVPIGLAEGMTDSGRIRLAPGMKIAGARESAEYNLFDYVRMLDSLPVPPTLIVLGPSAPEWSDSVNEARLARLGPLLRRACEELWRGVSQPRRSLLLSLSA